jgi:hypothetical protein
MEIIGQKELADALRSASNKIEGENGRESVWKMLFLFFFDLDEIFSMKVVHRLVFWECVYHVVNFLRLNGQLDRHECGFDKDVKNVMDSSLLMNVLHGDEK